MPFIKIYYNPKDEAKIRSILIAQGGIPTKTVDNALSIDVRQLRNLSGITVFKDSSLRQKISIEAVNKETQSLHDKGHVLKTQAKYTGKGAFRGKIFD